MGGEPVGVVGVVQAGDPMTTMRKAALLAALAAAVAGGWLWGRWSAPVPATQVAAPVATKESTAATKEDTRDSSLALDTRNTAGVRIRYVRRPDGTSECQGEVDTSATSHAAGRVAAATKETTTKVIEAPAHRVPVMVAPQARWQLGVVGTIGVDGRWGYGPVIGRRIGGPWWGQIGYDVKNKTVQAGLTVTW